MRFDLFEVTKTGLELLPELSAQELDSVHPTTSDIYGFRGVVFNPMAGGMQQIVLDLDAEITPAVRQFLSRKGLSVAVTLAGTDVTWSGSVSTKNLTDGRIRVTTHACQRHTARLRIAAWTQVVLSSGNQLILLPCTTS